MVDEGEAFDNGQPWVGGEYAAQCGATCGDGIVQNGEDCDDGNDSNADDCPTNCRAHRCGDGIVRQDLQPGEEGYESCDDGNSDDFDGCDMICNRCGDGVIGPAMSRATMGTKSIKTVVPIARSIRAVMVNLTPTSNVMTGTTATKIRALTIV